MTTIFELRDDGENLLGWSASQVIAGEAAEEIRTNLADDARREVHIREVKRTAEHDSASEIAWTK